MGLSSLLFRQESTEPATTTRKRPLRQLLKPWPQPAAAEKTPTEAEDAEWLSVELSSTLVRERLAQFTDRK